MDNKCLLFFCLFFIEGIWHIFHFNIGGGKNEVKSQFSMMNKRQQSNKRLPGDETLFSGCSPRKMLLCRRSRPEPRLPSLRQCPTVEKLLPCAWCSLKCVLQVISGNAIHSRGGVLGSSLSHDQWHMLYGTTWCLHAGWGTIKTIQMSNCFLIIREAISDQIWEAPWGLKVGGGGKRSLQHCTTGR